MMRIVLKVSQRMRILLRNKGRIKTLKKILKNMAAVCFSAVLAAVNSGLTVQAAKTEFTDEILTYTIQKDGVYISDCVETTSAVYIDEEIDGYKILGIEDGAFAECTKLTEVSLPDTITYMGTGAFSGCSSLEKINFPSGMTEIPEQTFALCGSLREIEIPDTVKTIGQYAFSYCDDLTWFEIPEGVTTISAYAFAFSNMPETLNIPNGVETVENMAFFTSSGVKTVNIPASVTSMGSLAFLGTESLSSYNVDKANETYSSEYGILYSENGTILECYPAGKDETTFTVSDNVEFIAGGSFFANSYLTEINLTENIKEIGEAAFSNCTALEKMTLPNSISSVPPSLLCDCTSLWSVTIPETVTSIGAYAFLECTNLQSVEIPDSVTEIGEYALGFTDDEEGNFHNMDNFTIKANFDSSAKTYAKSNDVDIEYLDGNQDLPKYIILVCVGVAAVGIIAFVIIRIILKRKKYKNYYSN